MTRRWDSPEARTRAIADLALNSRTMDAPESRADIAARLGVPSDEWPARPLSVTVVDTETCELVVFDARSGVSLIDAVAASCAVPGVRPPVLIQGRRYMDGGLWRTPDNVHLVRGERSVLILSPYGAVAPAMSRSLQGDVEELRQTGSRLALIAADARALSTLGPLGPLDPSIRAEAAEAGRAQGHREIENIRAWLG
jgi:NTE family protein